MKDKFSDFNENKHKIKYEIKCRKYSIIGLGLIGGSLARAFRQYLDIENITAVDKNTDSINQALREGTISLGFTEINDHVLDSDVIFICTPVKTAIDVLKKIHGKTKPGCIVTDVGSSKSEIINFVDSLPSPPCFVGGHPMAGAEKAGYASSFPHLFENAYYVLSPAKSTTDEAINIISELVRGIGAIPLVIDASEHDRATAGISHVPHIIASALVNMVKEMDSPDRKMQMLAAGGFKDITRIASSNPELWQNIVLSNNEQIKIVLKAFINSLYDFLEYIEKRKEDEIYRFFESAQRYRDTFSDLKKGAISSIYQLTVDVVDKPGIIGEIATLLGKNNINIKNINVSHSREFEDGCLIITLQDNESFDNAYKILREAGYKVYKRT